MNNPIDANNDRHHFEVTSRSPKHEGCRQVVDCHDQGHETNALGRGFWWLAQTLALQAYLIVNV